MKKIGTFKIETSNNITGRGIIVSGQVLEGFLKLGTYLSINISGEQEIIKVIGIERGNPDQHGDIKWGALLAIKDPLRVKLIGENKINEQVAQMLES